MSAPRASGPSGFVVGTRAPRVDLSRWRRRQPGSFCTMTDDRVTLGSAPSGVARHTARAIFWRSIDWFHFAGGSKR